MPEIFDHNDDWECALLSTEPNKSHLLTFYAAPSIGLLLQYSKCALVHSLRYFKNENKLEATDSVTMDLVVSELRLNYLNIVTKLAPGVGHLSTV